MIFWLNWPLHPTKSWDNVAILYTVHCRGGFKRIYLLEQGSSKIDRSSSQCNLGSGWAILTNLKRGKSFQKHSKDDQPQYIHGKKLITPALSNLFVVWYLMWQGGPGTLVILWRRGNSTDSPTGRVRLKISYFIVFFPHPRLKMGK